jgi:hypothetical protein
MTRYGFTPRQAVSMYRRYAKVLWKEYGINDFIRFSAKPYPKYYATDDAGMAETLFNPWTGKPFYITVDGTILPYLHEDELECLILHEMAHVIAGWAADHGEQWAKVCREIGAHPAEFYIFREWEKMPENYHPTEWMLSMWDNEPSFA